MECPDRELSLSSLPKPIEIKNMLDNYVIGQDAAKKALSGVNTAGKSLYFLNPRIAQNSWIVKNRKYYSSIGNHDFYL